MSITDSLLTDELLARFISGENITPLERIAFSESLKSEDVAEVCEISSDLKKQQYFLCEEIPEKKKKKIESFIENNVGKFREIESPESRGSKIY